MFLGLFGLKSVEAAKNRCVHESKYRHICLDRYVLFAEFHGDLFSRHACPLEGAIFGRGRSTKQS